MTAEFGLRSEQPPDSPQQDLLFLPDTAGGPTCLRLLKLSIAPFHYRTYLSCQNVSKDHIEWRLKATFADCPGIPEEQPKRVSSNASNYALPSTRACSKEARSRRDQLVSART
jgi:hypothetical protein